MGVKDIMHKKSLAQQGWMQHIDDEGCKERQSGASMKLKLPPPQQLLHEVYISMHNGSASDANDSGLRTAACKQMQWDCNRQSKWSKWWWAVGPQPCMMHVQWSSYKHHQINMVECIERCTRAEQVMQMTLGCRPTAASKQMQWTLKHTQ